MSLRQNERRAILLPQAEDAGSGAIFSLALGRLPSRLVRLFRLSALLVADQGDGAGNRQKMPEAGLGGLLIPDRGFRPKCTAIAFRCTAIWFGVRWGFSGWTANGLDGLRGPDGPAHSAGRSAAGRPDDGEASPGTGRLRLSAMVSENAADMAAVADGNWAVIAPYGEFPSPDRTYTQVFHKAQAEDVVRTWNSIPGIAARTFKNLMHGLGASAVCPGWDGHPETDRQRWPKEKLLCRITDLRAGDAGLEGRVTWNRKGLEARTRGPLFPSPLWWHFPPSGEPPRVYPELLESVGLVPTPNIANVPAWTRNAALYEGGGEPGAAKDGTQEDFAAGAAETKQEEEMNKKSITAALGLPETASDEEILAKLANVQGASTANAAAMQTANEEAQRLQTLLTTANAQVGTLTGERDSARAEITALTTTNSGLVEQLLVVLQKDGRVTPAEVEGARAAITANAGDAVKTLLEKKPAMNTQHVQIGANRVDITTANARSQAVQTEVRKRMVEQKMTYDQAFASVMEDPQLKALRDAMH